MKKTTTVTKDSNIKTFNTCFDNIYLNWACLKNKNLSNGPQFSFFYEYAHDRSILTLSLDESGTYMATGSADHSIRIHNLKQLSTIKELYHKKCGHSEWVNKVFFTKRNEILSGGLDGKICLWNTTYACKAPKINKIMNCSEYLEQASKNKEIKFKASTNMITCKEIYAHYSTISDMKFDKQTDKCITSSYDKTLKLFDLKKMNELAIYKGSHLQPITQFLWLHNKIISSDKNGTVCIFSVDTSQEIVNAKNTHNGNIGALNYFYLYKNNDEQLIKTYDFDNEKRESNELFTTYNGLKGKEDFDEDELDKSSNQISYNNNNKESSNISSILYNKKKDENNRNSTSNDHKNVSNSEYSLCVKENNKYLNLNKNRIPLLITGGQTDGTIKIRDFRIFHKYISCKKIHTASINCIITYNLNNRTYIISCSADGYCYQFEIHGICSSNLNNYLKKIYVKEPILSAKYIGNHLVLVGSAFGNLFLLNFSDCSENKLIEQDVVQHQLELQLGQELEQQQSRQQQFEQQKEQKRQDDKQIDILTDKSNHYNFENLLKKNILSYDKTNSDILWAFGACKKGGINCIECIYVYNSKNDNINEMEVCNIITAGDDGIPCLLSVPNSYA
ncbi:WD repeat-containing protein, putative [Hepatocystis sp. ex Piliocolobus tephrosceles]|nr:WD repeat-containing protein, putative [Hepatocystis sp. ex Piliocolobus tephrosceles]